VASTNSARKTFQVALLLCVACSLVVSGATVLLRKRQTENRELDRRKNILIAAGLYTAGVDVEKAFASIETRAIDIGTGKVEQQVDLSAYDERRAARDDASSIHLSPKEGLAGIKKIAKVYAIYLVKDDSGKIAQVILPIFGKGLWSTMYGFISVDKTLSAVSGVTFYEHGETPGLGAEITNPRWQNLWKGKAIYDRKGRLALEIVKGEVTKNTPDASHKIDGLASATITGRGVEATVRFWLGENGFGKYLKNLRMETGLTAPGADTTEKK
jgi:Na+-transporting NADH:ubiquinone oxidoreductase subunit C